MFTRTSGPRYTRANHGLSAGIASLVIALVAACSNTQQESTSSNALQLVSTSGMLVEGMRGEQLAATEHGFVIRNASDSEVDWAVTSDADWLSVADSSGRLLPGEESQIVVDLQADAVASLSASIHRGELSVSENNSASAALSIPFDLVLLPRPAQAAILHAPSFAPVGTEDGNFAPKHTTWSFENRGDLTLAWRVESSEEWLDAEGVLSGLLDPGDSLNVKLLIDEWLASSAGVGQHTAVVRLIDEASGETAYEQTVVMQVTSGIAIHEGWSVLRGSTGSRFVFVSDTIGDDANDGLSAQTPKKTIAAGKQLMRHGEPDYLMLRRGDVFAEGLGQWKTSGRSATEPQVVSTYGSSTVRPILQTGGGAGLTTHGGGGSPPTIDNVAFLGLHFFAHNHTGTGQPIGVALHRPSTNLLIEDCLVERYNTGLVIQAIDGRHTNVRLRRSVVVDSFGVNDGNPQGLYCVNTDGLLIEECVFDTNGWQPNVPGATADIFSHNIYIDTDNSDVILRGNTIANAASHGAQMRSGGLCHNNLFARNSIALMMAGGSGPDLNTSHATLNVIVDGKDIDAANPRGWGIDFNDCVGGDIRRNLITNNMGNLPIPIILDGGGFGGGVHDVTVVNNIIWNWGGSMWFTGESTELTDVDFMNNAVQNAVDSAFLVDHFTLSNHASVESAGNRFFSDLANQSMWMHQAGIQQSVPQWKQDLGDDSSMMGRGDFADPDRVLADYSASLGLAPTHEAFMAEARKQSRFNWRRLYTARAVNHWFRAGF